MTALPSRTVKKSKGGSEVYARYKIGAMGFSLEYFIKHMYVEDGAWVWDMDGA